jgi:hypothetical protein
MKRAETFFAKWRGMPLQSGKRRTEEPGQSIS